jgi:hypothetical protein
LLVAVALPAFLSEAERLIELAVSVASSSPQNLSIPWLSAPLQAAVTVWLAWRLHSDLKRRQFAFQRAAG